MLVVSWRNKGDWLATMYDDTIAGNIVSLGLQRHARERI